jgi:hypothetical protein
MTVDELAFTPPAPRGTNRPRDTQAQDPLLNSAEAAAYLNVPITTLRSRRAVWGLHPFRVGRALMWRKSELDAWLERNREGTDPGRADAIPA